ncbi:hypothetical protein B0H21DRAFT_772729 [Amylocystis lapponica]|nr:hypothetical protein B0H21DRAFT_772729 [Amylocystis lapponica]
MVQLNELLVGASNHVAAQRAERESAAMEVDEDPGPSRLSAGPSVELEELRRRVAAIEERLADVGNDLVHREGELPDELYSLVEEKVHTMMSAHQAEQNRAAKQDRLIESLQKELKVSGEQSAMLVKDVGALARRTDAVHAENVHLRDENAELRAMVKQLQGVQTEKMEVMDSNLHALIAEVKARLEITSGAVPAPVPDMEDVLRHVTPPLMQKVHEELGPILVELHKTIRGMLDAQNTELRGTIFSKLAVTLKMVETVQAWADRLGVAGAGSVAHRQPGAH